MKTTDNVALADSGAGKNCYAIIIAGGSGVRFWPLSTAARPKQFLELFGGQPLIAQAVARLEGLFPPERILVVTDSRLVDLTRAALPGLPAGNIFGEPCRRETAAAIAVADALVLRRGGENAVGCVLPADHLIAPAAEFRRTLAAAMGAAASGAIVTVGIRPDRPETGYGYIELGEVAMKVEDLDFQRVARFVEKPSRSVAEQYLAAGRYLWNAGMFVWCAGALRSEFAAVAADFLPLIDAVAHSDDAAAAMAELYPQLRSISFDFAVMEHARQVLVTESGLKWDDVGSWGAVERQFPVDALGNVIQGAAVLRDSEGVTVVNAESGHHVVAVGGLKDVVVVHTPQATLVCAKSELAQLRELVAAATAGQTA